MGCGFEATKGKCDTPGFPCIDLPQVKFDHRRAQKLYMPRNHQRLNQTSTFLLQSWRANCDLQVLVYDGDPNNPNIAEIAKITDYVVSYSCKGNTTWKEETEQTKKLIAAAEDVTGDKEELKRICKKVLNKTASKRIISKQESMVMLAELPLTYCTEAICGVSINNSSPLRIAGEHKRDRRFITTYANRPSSLTEMNLYDFFLFEKNHGERKRSSGKYIIPNFYVFSGTPRFPVTESYARHSLIVYKPWRKYPTGLDWISEFNAFVHSKECPIACRMGYSRVMQ